MKQVDIHEVETQLSYLLAGVAAGEPFIIVEAGKPFAKVEAFNPTPPTSLIWCMKGQIDIPEDFDTMGAETIAGTFGTAD